MGVGSPHPSSLDASEPFNNNVKRREYYSHRISHSRPPSARAQVFGNQDLGKLIMSNNQRVATIKGIRHQMTALLFLNIPNAESITTAD